MSINKTIQTMTVKTTMMMSLLSAVLGSQAFAADNKANEMKKNAWETVCEQGVAAACVKAGSFLEDKMVATSDDKEEAALRTRLLHVSRIGCGKNDLAACSQLFENSESANDVDSQLAKEVSNRQCSAGNQAACAQVSRFEEAKTATIDLGELEFAAEFLTASK